MQGSPASPKATLPSLFAEQQDGIRLPLLPLSQLKKGVEKGLKTPGTLTKGAHRVPNSALKDTSTKLSFAGAVNHFSLFEKVEHAEKENADLKLQLLACRGDLHEALEKAKEAEAAQAAAAFHTSTEPEQEGDAGGNDLHLLSKPQLIERLLALQKELASAQHERRQAVNQLVEMKGAIRVYCRVRPPSPAAPASCLRVLPDGSSLGITCNNQDSVFNFNRVFGPSASQQAVYQEVAELVQSALDGYHVCIMSYGQTGSGKTHNMVGNQSADGQGLIPRAIDKIMGSMRRLGLQGWEYKLELSCVEVYNNSVRDLLDPKAQHIKDMNAIKHDAQGGHTIIQGVEQVELRTASQAHTLLQKAMEARACNATAMNSSSSRSHSAFMLNISGTHAPSETHLKGALCLVDLAGSERLDRSRAVGARKAEACAINTSLSSIGDVFEALSTKQKHVPFRNSKLTYLLKPCLSPGGKVLMMVHVQPEPASAYESLTSLRFATKVGGTELGQASKRAIMAGAPTALPNPQQTAPVPAATAATGVAQGVEAGALSSRRPATAGPPAQHLPHPAPATTTTSFWQLQEAATANGAAKRCAVQEKGGSRRVGMGGGSGGSVRGSSGSTSSNGSGGGGGRGGRGGGCGSWEGPMAVDWQAPLRGPAAERGVPGRVVGSNASIVEQHKNVADAALPPGAAGVPAWGGEDWPEHQQPHQQQQLLAKGADPPKPGWQEQRQQQQQQQLPLHQGELGGLQDGRPTLPVIGLQHYQHLAPSAQLQLLQSVQMQGANHRYANQSQQQQQQQQQHLWPALAPQFLQQQQGVIPSPLYQQQSNGPALVAQHSTNTQQPFLYYDPSATSQMVAAPTAFGARSDPVGSTAPTSCMSGAAAATAEGPPAPASGARGCNNAEDGVAGIGVAGGSAVGNGRVGTAGLDLRAALRQKRMQQQQQQLQGCGVGQGHPGEWGAKRQKQTKGAWH